MKKLKIVIILVFMALILVCCIRFYSKGHDVTYKLGKNKQYQVHEIYTKKEKNELDNYYLEITVNKINFNFQLFDTYKEKREIVEDIIYYDGEYKCLLPIIDGKAQTDILCYKNNRYYNYISIAGKEEKLDEFVDDIDINLYDKDTFLDKSTETLSKDGIKLYTYNVQKNHFLALSNLQGIYLINDNIDSIQIFDKDVYARELSTVVGNYYVTADYSAKQQFRTFYFIELSTGKKSEAKAPDYISFDSYIQGVVDGKIYLYDRDREKQYSIDPKKKEIKEVGNKKRKIKYYADNDWDKITVTKANNEVKFDYYIDDYDFSKFDYVQLIGGKYSGYYYLYQKSGNYYNVYRTPVQNKKGITYLFKVEKLDDVFYVDEYIYYRLGNQLKYYSDQTGIRTLIEYNELQFNESIIFGVYNKK